MLSHIPSLVLLLAHLHLTASAPFSFKDNPLGNSFPQIVSPSDQLTQISIAAHGSLPNGPPPNRPSDDSFTSLRLIAFNELFEVAFFTQLLSNITKSVSGYEIADPTAKKFMVDSLTAVQAQEEIHVLNANSALVAFGNKAVEPCEYQFPVEKLKDAISLASTFTDVVLGTLQDVVSRFGKNGDSDLILGVASVIGQEGEQNGWYRSFLKKIPSALPFLTTSSREFAFSALQGFTVPGSCPDLGTIGLQIFDPLTVLSTGIEAKNLDLKFSVTLPEQGEWKKEFSMTYINQQNVPVSKEIRDVNVLDRTVTFTANFPYDAATFGNGLTLAVVTNSTGGLDFQSADAVVEAAVFGPGLIEIN